MYYRFGRTDFQLAINVNRTHDISRLRNRGIVPPRLSAFNAERDYTLGRRLEASSSFRRLSEARAEMTIARIATRYLTG